MDGKKTRSALKNLKPRRWKSKAGGQTYVFTFFTGKIKIYQAANSTHASFLAAALRHPDLAPHFHRILFPVRQYLISDWIPGVTAEQLPRSDQYQVIDWIVVLQTCFHRMKLFPDDQQAGFSYLDYLKKRLLQYAPPDLDSDLTGYLYELASIPPVLNSHLSHPDVTTRNIIRSQGSGTFKLIDNELFSQSPFFLLDILNTCHGYRRDPELVSYYLEQYLRLGERDLLQPGWKASLAAAWAIRLAGSYFQAREYDSGTRCLLDWDQGYERIFEMIENIKTRTHQAGNLELDKADD